MHAHGGQPGSRGDPECGVCGLGRVRPGTVERLSAPLALRAATAWFWFGKSTSRGVHFFLDIGTDCHMFCVPHPAPTCCLASTVGGEAVLEGRTPRRSGDEWVSRVR